MTIESSTRDKVIDLHNSGKKRHEIKNELNTSGIQISTWSISNVIAEWRQREEKREKPVVNKSDVRVATEEMEFKKTQDFEKNDYNHIAQRGAPLSWFVNSYQSEGAVNDKSEGNNDSKYTSSTTIDTGSPSFIGPRVGLAITSKAETNTETVPKKIYPQEPKFIQERFDIERRAWHYYGFAWSKIMDQITHEKCQRRRELRMIDYRKNKLEEWKKRLEKREQELQVREPFLSAVKKLQEMKLTLDDIRPWIQMIEEVAQMQKITIKQAAIYVAQDLKFYQQLGGVQRQIERANQELGLINMAVIQKQKAVAVVEGLLNRGITESQIINFSWQVQQPNNISPGSSHNSSNVNISNGNGFSMQDWIKLNFLKGATSNMLNRMGTIH